MPSIRYSWTRQPELDREEEKMTRNNHRRKKRDEFGVKIHTNWLRFHNSSLKPQTQDSDDNSIRLLLILLWFGCVCWFINVISSHWRPLRSLSCNGTAEINLYSLARRRFIRSRHLICDFVAFKVIGQWSFRWFVRQWQMGLSWWWPTTSQCHRTHQCIWWLNTCTMHRI